MIFYKKFLSRPATNIRTFWILILTSLPSVAFAQSENASQFQFESVQLGAVSAVQSSGYSGGFVVRYLPSYTFTDRLSGGVSVDVTLLKLKPSSTFAAFGYLAFAKWKLSDQFYAQFNVGAQTWICTNGSTQMMLGPTLIYNLDPSAFSLIKNLWFSYLPVFQNRVAHLFQIGIGIEI